MRKALGISLVAFPFAVIVAIGTWKEGPIFVVMILGTALFVCLPIMAGITLLNPPPKP